VFGLFEWNQLCAGLFVCFLLFVCIYIAIGNEDQQLSAAIEMCQVQSTILYRQYINQQVNVKPCYENIV
jgi:hypothetical protein